MAGSQIVAQCRQYRETRRKDHRSDAGDEDGPRGSPSIRSVLAARQESVGENEQRKTAVPEDIKPGGCLRPGLQEAGWTEDSRKRERVRHDHRSEENVACGKNEQRPRAKLHELAKQQSSDDDVDDQRTRPRYAGMKAGTSGSCTHTKGSRPQTPSGRPTGRQDHALLARAGDFSQKKAGSARDLVFVRQAKPRSPNPVAAWLATHRACSERRRARTQILFRPRVRPYFLASLPRP